MKRYEKYKDSKVAWLGQIPEHWQDVRLASCFTEVKETNKDSEFDRAFQFKYGNIVYKKDAPIDAEAIATFKKYAKVNENDIVVNGLNLNYDFLTQRVAIVHQRGIITSAYITMTPRDIIVPKFACYLLKGIDEKKLLNGMGTGIRLTLSFGELKKQYIPYPSVAEHEQIVRYLDWKVAMADKFVREKRREITLLKELRQAEINRAVTRGLAPTAPTKPSGIDWVGDIPEHWEPIRLKQVAEFNPSIQKELKNFTNDDHIVFLPMEKISTSGDIDNSEKRAIKDVRSGFTSFKRGDIVVAKITPCFENGKGALLNDLETEIGYGTTELIVMRSKENIIDSYLFLIFRSDIFRKNGTNFMTGSAGQKRIPLNFIKNFQIGLPETKSEQQQIVEHIQTIEANINKAIEKIENEIALTAEYKTRLISDVTTGQVDVRGIEIPDYTVEEATISDNEETEE